jgi:hypothetical protein
MKGWALGDDRRYAGADEWPIFAHLDWRASRDREKVPESRARCRSPAAVAPQWMPAKPTVGAWPFSAVLSFPRFGLDSVTDLDLGFDLRGG